MINIKSRFVHDAKSSMISKEKRWGGGEREREREGLVLQINDIKFYDGTS